MLGGGRRRDGGRGGCDQARTCWTWRRQIVEAVAAEAMSPCAAQVASTCEWLSLKLRQKWRTDFCTYWAVPGSSRSNGK